VHHYTILVEVAKTKENNSLSLEITMKTSQKIAIKKLSFMNVRLSFGLKKTAKIGAKIYKCNFFHPKGKETEMKKTKNRNFFSFNLNF